MDAPHNALLSSVAIDPGERVTLSAVRLCFSSIATGAVVLAMPALMAAQSVGGAAPLAKAAIAAGALSLVVMVIAAASSRRHDRPTPDWHLIWRKAETRRDSLRLRAVAVVLSTTLVLNTGVPLFAKMLVYHAGYVVADPSRVQTMLSAMVIGQLVGLIPWILIVRLIAPRLACGVACGLIALVGIVMLATGGNSAIIDLASALTFGVGVGGIYTLIWVLVAEGIERDGAGASTGLIYGLVIVAMKLGQGFGVLITGQCLSEAGYVPGVSTPTGMGPTISALQYGGPMIASFAAIALLTVGGRYCWK